MTATTRTNDALARIARLAAAERAFLREQFLAPVVRGAAIRVRVAGVALNLRAEPPDFAGWGVFRPASYASAALVRPASLVERRRYLDLFPAAPLVLLRPEGADWLASPADGGPARLRTAGEVAVRLVGDAEPLDVVRARFDGANFWFDELDPRADPAAGAYLRRALAVMAEPGRLDRPGLTAGQRAAYARLHLRRAEHQLADARQRGERRLRDALAHAGAALREHADRGEVYHVVYTVDGRRHASLVNKSDLTVRTAGICLSGGDRHFDLQSLVGVIREGESGGVVVRTG